MEHKTEDMNRAIDRFSAAVEEFARQVERMNSPEPPGEEEAVRLAREGVREVRNELRAEREKEPRCRRPAPNSEEVRAWEKRREERREHEGHRPR